MIVERRRLLRLGLAFGDAVTVAGGFAAAYAAVDFGFERNFVSFARYEWLLALIVPVWLICLAAFGFYDSSIFESNRWLFGRLLQVQMVGGAVLFSFMYLTRSWAISRLLLESFVAFGFVFLAAQRFALKTYLDWVSRRRPLRRRKVLLVSASEVTGPYQHLVGPDEAILFEVIGIVKAGAPNDQRDAKGDGRSAYQARR